MEYRVDADNPIPLIYQSGYLTIKGYDKEFQLYRLAFPNDEVRYGFLNFLVPLKTRCLKEELEKSNVIGWLIEMYVF